MQTEISPCKVVADKAPVASQRKIEGPEWRASQRGRVVGGGPGIAGGPMPASYQRAGHLVPALATNRHSAPMHNSCPRVPICASFN